MITPTIILALLCGPALFWHVLGLKGGFQTGARCGLAAAFLFFAIGHFVQTEGMARMLPVSVPCPRQIIHLTGGLEFEIAVGLLFPAIRNQAGWAAVAVLDLFFPANIYATIQHVEFGGHAWGPSYLLIRASLQGLLLWWAWRFVFSYQSRPD